ncbi:hypothetical protein BDK51DRAFT_19960 [Blyttiomyces helicus]|uniref:Uncharacterized protein n=1 Tax=Blyttiomyces helicus TaxID=388810 RepID=A0A4P9WKM4_9FUNG|nr:hypothetical protein BDK51DRAFT_19960 [Blyttiomyces helicus]|eukprot:RKO93541.1 hypothetical protein BDK51DRAFT_19960 [Blyttiomyces helicus]
MNNFAAKEFYSIVVGGSVLSLNAGFINVVTLAGVFSVTVSHVTGNVSRVAISIYEADLTTLALVGSIIFSFMFGSFMAGLMVGDNKFRLGRGYGYALLLESAALFGSFIFLRRELIVGEWLAAFGCGLQNALATSYSGAVVRTTHMTGICTDIGNILGQACRKDTKAETWRLRVHVPLLAAYLLGGILGQAAYLGMQENSLLFPCFFTGGMAIAYLTLPFVRVASEAFRGAAATAAANGGGPALEVRILGDPSRTDMFAKVQGRDVDLDIRNFLSDIDDEPAPVDGGESGRVGHSMAERKASVGTPRDAAFKGFHGGGSIEVLYVASPSTGDIMK